jgi:hypothetical protein
MVALTRVTFTLYVRTLPVFFPRICVRGRKTYLVKTAKSFFGHPSFSSLLDLPIKLPLLSKLPSNILYLSYLPCKLRVPPMTSSPYRLVKITNYEAPHYINLCIPVTFSHFDSNILSPFCQILCIFFP